MKVIMANDIVIQKGDKLRIDFNPHRWGNGLPDIQEATVMHDDPPKRLSEFTSLLVGRTKNEFYSVSVNQVVLNGVQKTFIFN